MQRAFKSFTIRLNFITGNELQWSLNPGFNDPLPYNFEVQASTSIDFFQIIYSINVGEGYCAVDNSNIKQNWSKDLYYRCKLTTGDPTDLSKSTNIYYSEPISFDSAPTSKRKYRMAADICRKFNVAARFAGKQGYLLKRKIYGEVDTANVDAITGLPLNNNVGGFGTGLIGGYYNPVPIVFITDDSMKDKALSSDANVKEMEQISVKVNGYPYVDSFDIIVNALNNKRYQVDGIKYIFFPGTEIVLSQKLGLKLIPPTDPIYQIEIPKYDQKLPPPSQQPNV